ncbi:MAG: DUF3352 domain-containing protein [Kastovskya adunca ATA6-11-RM4]|jgi:hypothetical protein|nr:DUF3352 domain-containing protein [Kastovskya adunca ATA6-11-RM4]
MPKHNKSFLLLALGAAVLLVGGAGVTYWLLVQRNFLQGNIPNGATLIPQDALMTISVSTDTRAWQQVKSYGTPETQAALENKLGSLEESLLDANGYNYSRDVEPWLGDTVMLAYVATGVVSVATPLQTNVMVLPIKNWAQIRGLLEKTQSQLGVVERTYKGIPIYESRNSEGQQFSATVLERFLVVADTPQALDRVIDTYKGGASIATTPGYAENLGKIRTLAPFAQMYFNVPAIAATAAANSTQSLSVENVAQAQQKQGIATSVMLKPEGLQFQGISWLKPDSRQTFVVENTPGTLPRLLPADTLVMMSGGHLVRWWQDYVKGTQSNPLSFFPPATLRAGVKETTGLEWEQDLLPWMNGEFVWGLIPAAADTDSNLGAAMVFMVQVSDRRAAEQSFQKLDQVMASRYQFQVNQSQLGGQAVVNWTSPLGGISATHGWLDDNKIAFLTIGAPLAQTIVLQPKTTLTQTPLFQQIVPSQPKPNNGQFFLDVERLLSAENLMLPQLPPEQIKFVKAIRTIGVTAAIADERSSRFDIFVQLKSTRTSNPSTNKAPALPQPSFMPSPGS